MTRRPSRHRLLAAALAVSVALHAIALGELPGWSFDSAPPAPPPLQARLLPPPEPPVPLPAATVSPKAEPPRPAKPRPAPVPRRAAAAPASTAAAAAPASDQPVAASESPALVAESPAVEEPAATPAPVEPPPVTAAPPPAPADYPLRNVRLVYDLLHGESATRVGQVVHRFSTDGRSYQAEAVAEAVGFVSLVFRGKFVQRSQGVIGPGGLEPSEYSLERGRGDPPERAVFDRAEGRLDFAWREERRVEALPPGTQDPLSMLHQLYFMQPLPLSSKVSIASSRKLGRHVYEALGDEDLLTPMGLVRALHLGRVEQDGSVLEVWLDRDRDLLPVRIYSRDRKGTILDQVVREVTLLEERPIARVE